MGSGPVLSKRTQEQAGDCGYEQQTLPASGISPAWILPLPAYHPRQFKACLELSHQLAAGEPAQ